ncbi:pyridoxal-dependent decarboxylase [Selenomonas caprae]|uniref:Pyridoxal-dependent decarboxylase n=1 Tax=Selenomonas caprae TaxID=2606905 RepID=A0A5D6WKL3_9FIRM|nr:alanine racemase [Selenomonas caprae]TYZ29121.1 pyridoxal-dependent decarboxylase [Selenomonas caprae]
MELTGTTLRRLRKEYGDAFYLLDSVAFKNNYQELKAAFSSIYPKVNIAYSYKTNYTPKLCKIVADYAGYAEVVSEMELELALKIGVAPENIIWNGPIKSRAHLEKYIKMGVEVNIDSWYEMEEIIAIAAQVPDKKLRVGLRCNFDVGDKVLSRFGFDADSDEFIRAIEAIKQIDNLEFVSLQCHFAKRSLEYWPSRAKGMLAIIAKYELKPQRIDIGGGLYGKMEDSLKAQFAGKIPSYQDYANAVAPFFADYYREKDCKPELVIEPGSALVGDCMKFVGTVKTIKNIRGKNIATVLGSQKNISMAGVNPPLAIISMGENQTHYSNMDIVGFTCIEGDVLYRNYNGELAVGDAVVISNCGSYSLVMKPPFILPNFPVLDITSESPEVVKRGETFDDIFHTFNF